ncbi:MAG: hypothetical protein V3V08_23420 [Nannocystaceae bacterium]
MKVALLVLIASLAFASPAQAAEGDLFSVGIPGVRVSLVKPEFDLLQLSTVLVPRIEVSLCELMGKTVSGGFRVGGSYIGLNLCEPGA